MRIIAVICAIVVGAALAHAGEPPSPPAYAVPRSAVLEAQTGERTYRLYVATPPGYDAPENASRRYPVIYLNDGELFFLAAAGGPLLSYYNRILEETIIVGISYAAGEDAIASRQRDLTPVRDKSFANDTGGAGDYLATLKSSIVPLVEATYRADPERRTLAGHSLGATFGVYVLLTEPNLFSNYILISPALWFGGHATAALEERYAAAHDDLRARVYLAAGELEGPKGGLKAVDLVNDQTAFAAKLRSRNYRSLVLRDEVLAGGVNHATSFSAAWLRALAWLFPAK